MLDLADSTSETALSRVALQLSVYKPERKHFLQPQTVISPARTCGPDLVLQPAAALLLLLHLLLQPESLLPARAQLQLGLPVVLGQSIQQALSLCDGEIPFSDGLLVLCKFLGE